MGWDERAADDAEREREEFAWLRENYDKHAAELAALRAILDGRTAPPTRAEVIAHCEAGGAWLVTVPRRRVVGSMFAPCPEFADDANAQVFDDAVRCLAWMHEGPVTRVIALGRDRRPCAWPVTP